MQFFTSMISLVTAACLIVHAAAAPTGGTQPSNYPREQLEPFSLSNARRDHSGFATEAIGPRQLLGSPRQSLPGSGRARPQHPGQQDDGGLLPIAPTVPTSPQSLPVGDVSSLAGSGAGTGAQVPAKAEQKAQDDSIEAAGKTAPKAEKNLAQDSTAVEAKGSKLPEDAATAESTPKEVTVEKTPATQNETIPPSPGPGSNQ